MKGCLILLILLTALGCTAPEQDRLVVYSGRSKSLVEPLVASFQERTGRVVDVRYGDTAQLAVALIEEGDRTDADLFWAQDAGSLGAVAAAGLLQPLPDSLLDRVEPRFRGSGARWIATSGRARTIAYSTERVDTRQLPSSVLDLTQPEYRDRVGWAPSNGSFQAFVTAMRLVRGEQETRAWLEAMKQNGARAYPKNTAILQGIANGEIDFGLPNHYYLHRFKAEDPGFPVDQTTFAPGDIGNLVNVAGVGITAPTDSRGAALELVGFLLSTESQEFFRRETFEYPVSSVAGGKEVAPDTLYPPVVLDDLNDLQQTLELLRETGLL